MHKEIAGCLMMGVVAGLSIAFAPPSLRAEEPDPAATGEAKSDVQSLSTGRQQLEAKIEAAEGPDSPITEMRGKYEAAKLEHTREHDRVLSSPEYLDQKSKAEAAGKSASQIAQLTKEALAADSAYSSARVHYTATRAKYQRMQRELFEKNPEWVANTKSARAGQKDAAAAKEKAQSAALHKSSGQKSAGAAGKAAAKQAWIAKTRELNAAKKQKAAESGKNP